MAMSVSNRKGAPPASAGCGLVCYGNKPHIRECPTLVDRLSIFAGEWAVEFFKKAKTKPISYKRMRVNIVQINSPENRRPKMTT